MIALRSWLLVGLLTLPIVACKTTADPVGDLQPNHQPNIQTDEASLWMIAERWETAFRTSGYAVRDPALNQYVGRIICRLSEDYCQSIRIYILQVGAFNAFMLPNGAMGVTTGLLLRAENEAQVAYILGHELAHYIKRHTLLEQRTRRSNTLGLALLGLAYEGQLAAFSRDNERVADELGFRMLVEAGYEAGEAARIWRHLAAENEVGADEKDWGYVDTHPSDEERAESMTELAATLGNRRGEIGRETLLETVTPFRDQWLRDEIRNRDFGRLEVVLDQQLRIGAASGLVHFYRGELHRMRGDDGDEMKAIEHYERAVGAGNAPPETYRSLGLVHWAVGNDHQAEEALMRYLAEAPQAEDRAMIEHYIEQL